MQKIYPCKFTDDFKRLSETSLPEIEEFYCHLNMVEDIIDADYAHAKKVCQDFKTKNIGEYCDLYVQRDTLLLFDVFENFRKICHEIHELGPCSFTFHTRMRMASSLKKD